MATMAKVTDRPAFLPLSGPRGGPSHERIAQRAYQIWLATGRPDGRAQEHWFRAERELTESPWLDWSAHYGR